MNCVHCALRRYWYGMEAVYKVWVEGKQLSSAVRRMCSPHYTPTTPFNIVVGVRPMQR